MRISLAVLRRKKNALSLRAEIKMNGPTLLRELEASQTPFRLEGGDGPDHALQLEELDRMIAVAFEELERADDQHFAEIDNDDDLRRERDAATDELVRVLIDHSITIDRNYSNGKAKSLLGLGPGIEAIPDHVHDVARRASDRLGKDGFSFGTPTHDGVELHPERVKGEVDAPLQRLSTALQELREEQRKFNNSLRRKRDAIEEFDRVYPIAADWLKVMYRAAGLELLAERVKPTVPKPSMKEEEEVVEDDTRAEGSAEELAAEPPADEPAAEDEGPPAADPATESLDAAAEAS